MYHKNVPARVMNKGKLKEKPDRRVATVCNVTVRETIITPLRLRLQDNPHRSVEVGGDGGEVGNVRPANSHEDVKGGDHFRSS